MLRQSDIFKDSIYARAGLGLIGDAASPASCPRAPSCFGGFGLRLKTLDDHAFLEICSSVSLCALMNSYRVHPLPNNRVFLIPALAVLPADQIMAAFRSEDATAEHPVSSFS